jgi:hypothetical protein
MLSSGRSSLAVNPGRAAVWQANRAELRAKAGDIARPGLYCAWLIARIKFTQWR